MRKYLLIRKIAYLALLFSMVSFSNAYSEVNSKNCYDTARMVKHASDILKCSQEVLAKTPIDFKLISSENEGTYTKFIYSFKSINWPLSSKQDIQLSSNSGSKKVWDEELEVYVPNNLRNSSIIKNVIMIIDQRDTNVSDSTIQAKSADFISHKIIDKLASNNIIIHLKETLDANLINRNINTGDQLLAYSWRKFILNPYEYTYFNILLPIKVAVIQAMNLSQQVLHKERNVAIKGFTLINMVGSGWGTWLSSISDERVKAMIAISEDSLNLEEQLLHVYKTYGQNWPIAVQGYYKEHIDEYLNPSNSLYPNFKKLMQVSDPYLYFNIPEYNERIRKVSKYLINPSGDDFFTPDSSSLYFDKIPGSKALVYIPNSPRYINYTNSINELIDSIAAFKTRVDNLQELPVVKTYLKDRNTLTVKFNEKPVQAILWRAYNSEARDFRYACNIRYQSRQLKLKNQSIKLTLEMPRKGWSATFVELIFKDGLRMSTPVIILPETYPDAHQAIRSSDECSLIKVRTSDFQPKLDDKG